MDDSNLDAYIPADMAKRAEASAVRKANRDFLSALFLAIQAGAFIAFGAAFFTHVIHDSTLGIGLTRLLGGLAFSLGLILVIIAGADLFTGDTLMVMACYSRSIKVNQMLRSWLIVLVGNLIGALAIVLLVYLSGHWLTQDAAIGAVALEIAYTKTSLTFTQAFGLGKQISTNDRPGLCRCEYSFLNRGLRRLLCGFQGFLELRYSVGGIVKLVLKFLCPPLQS